MLHSLGLIHGTDTCIAALKSPSLRILHWHYFCMQSCTHSAHSILSLAASAAFSFADLKGLSLGVGTHMLCLGQEFVAVSKKALPFCLEQHWGISSRSGLTAFREKVEIKKKNPNKRRSLEIHLTKSFLTQKGGDVQHLQLVKLTKKHLPWGMRGLLLLLAAVTASGSVVRQRRTWKREKPVAQHVQSGYGNRFHWVSLWPRG